MILKIGSVSSSGVRFFHHGDRIYPCFRSEGRIWFCRPARAMTRIESVRVDFASRLWTVRDADGGHMSGSSDTTVAEAISKELDGLPSLEFYL